MSVRVTINLLAVLLFLPQGKHPAHVDYGKSVCTYCRMIIEKKQFGGELETMSGNVLAFDAIECLAASYYREWNVPVREIRAIRVMDYSNPGTLIKASTATFLRTSQVESPMGVNIVALPSRAAAQAMKKAPGDSILAWKECIRLVRSLWNLPPPGKPR